MSTMDDLCERLRRNITTVQFATASARTDAARYARKMSRRAPEKAATALPQRQEFMRMTDQRMTRQSAGEIIRTHVPCRFTHVGGRRI